MKVIVDTCVWSLALRRQKIDPSAVVTQLKGLINASLVQMIGPIRQEVLSGISSLVQFKKLQSYLSAFEDLALEAKVYELAAELYNTCKKNGVQGSNTDFLICAAAISHKAMIFTVDKDFMHFTNYIPITLLHLGTGQSPY